MSAAQRVQQWLTMSRQWYLFDAKWQDPFKSGVIIAQYLKGTHKPIFGGSSDTGDHVVVINSQDIAMKGDDWYYRVYFHHTGYPGGATWTKAYELHQKDPTMILWKSVYKVLGNNLERRPRMARLHIFKDGQVSPQLLENVSNQIRPIQKVPKRLDQYTKGEIDNFPKLWDYPKDYVLK